MRGITYRVDLASLDTGDDSSYIVTGGKCIAWDEHLCDLPAIQISLSQNDQLFTPGPQPMSWDNIIEKCINDDDFKPDNDDNWENPSDEIGKISLEFYQHYKEILKGEYPGGFRLIGFSVLYGSVTLYYCDAKSQTYCFIPLEVNGAVDLKFELPANGFGFRPTYHVKIVRTLNSDGTEGVYNYTSVSENHGFMTKDILFELKDPTLSREKRTDGKNTYLLIQDCI